MSKSNSSSKSSSSKSVSKPSVVKTDDTVALLSVLISLVIGGMLYYYVTLLEKEKCECSKMWQRDYIKYYYIAMIVLLVLQLVLGKNLRMGLHGLWVVATIVNIYAMFSYGTVLYKTECTCAVKDHHNLYNFMVFYNYFQIIGVILSLLIFVSMIFTMIFKK